MAALLTPDICIIGGGTGGILAALRARALGASVVLVEKGQPGGTTGNRAALASKALVAAARRAHLINTAGPFGVGSEEVRINARGVFDHVHAVLDGAGRDGSTERLTALGIDVVQAEGRFVDRRTLAAGDRLVRARRFVIATGSRPAIPAIPGLGDVPYFTSTSIFDNPRKLTHLVIIGAGPAGIELAQAFRRLGSEVTVVDKAGPLSGIDPELAGIALRQLADEGVTIRAETSVTQVQARSLGIGVVIQSGGAEQVLDASHILVAAGRMPEVAALDLAKAGIRLDAGGAALALRHNFRTSNHRIYAIGDAAGGPRSSHAARYHAEQVVSHALFGAPLGDPAGRVPVAIFTDPEIAEIGLTEPEARRRYGDRFRVLRFALSENDRARAERQTYGLAKLIVDRRGRLLGAGIAGSGAGELIALFALAIGNGLALRHFRRFVAGYPTLSEIAHGLADEAARTAESPFRARLLALRRMLP